MPAAVAEVGAFLQLLLQFPNYQSIVILQPIELVLHINKGLCFMLVLKSIHLQSEIVTNVPNSGFFFFVICIESPSLQPTLFLSSFLFAECTSASWFV